MRLLHVRAASSAAFIGINNGTRDPSSRLLTPIRGSLIVACAGRLLSPHCLDAFPTDRRSYCRAAHWFCSLCGPGWLSGAQVAALGVGPPAGGCLGRLRGIQRMGLPTDTVRELATSAGRRNGLCRRLHRSISVNDPLSGIANPENPNYDGHAGVGGEPGNLWPLVVGTL